MSGFFKKEDWERMKREFMNERDFELLYEGQWIEPDYDKEIPSNHVQRYVISPRLITYDRWCRNTINKPHLYIPICGKEGLLANLLGKRRPTIHILLGDHFGNFVYDPEFVEWIFRQISYTDAKVFYEVL